MTPTALGDPKVRRGGAAAGVVADLAVEVLEEAVEVSLVAVAEAAAEVQVEVGRKSPVVDAIAAAETKTSGEIRVHISQRFFDFKPLKSARYVFFQLGMFDTKARNGILIYLNIRKKKAAIFGDEGIYKKIDQTEWDELLAKLVQNLRTTHYENALAKCVEEMGTILAKYFPADRSKNRNELSNELSKD